MELECSHSESISGCGIGDEDKRVASFDKIKVKQSGDLLSGIFHLFAVPGDARLREQEGAEFVRDSLHLFDGLDACRM